MANFISVWSVAAFAGFAAAGGQPQFRGFWVDGFNPGFKTPEQVGQLVADLKACHCNAVIVQVRKRGDALFRRSIEPFTEDKAIPAGFDPLSALLDAAHPLGIQVHAWVNVGTVWPGTAAPPKSPDHIFNRHGPSSTGRDDWLSRDDAGSQRMASGYFTDPGNPDFAEHFTRVVRELVRNYPVDGVHFDFVRYSETSGDLERGYGAGYNPTSIARFNRSHGRSGQPDRGDPAWKDWRRQQVTQLVRRVRVALVEDKPRIVLSAALIPWGDGPVDEAAWSRSAPFNRVFQDWHAWRKEGLLDLIVPMNYDRDDLPAQKRYFDNWIAFEKRFRGRAMTVIGIGAYMNSLDDTVSQVKRAFAPLGNIAGADGVCFYRHGYVGPGRAKDFRADFDGLRQRLVDGDTALFATSVKPPMPPRLAQPTEGVIAGQATGADGQPLDNATVVIESSAGPPVRCLTDGNGHFAALGLAPGNYRVTVPSGAVPKSVDVTAGRVIRITN